MLIKHCIRQLYFIDHELFTRNSGQGLSERCLVFRLAHYLQNIFDNIYFVDCDFNSSSADGRLRDGKQIMNPDGTITRRFVDIIVHKRLTDGRDSDFICIEIKKWNNLGLVGIRKDENNLRVLTSIYGYRFGFHIFLGETMRDTKWTIFGRNEYHERQSNIFRRNINRR